MYDTVSYMKHVLSFKRVSNILVRVSNAEISNMRAGYQIYCHRSIKYMNKNIKYVRRVRSETLIYMSSSHLNATLSLIVLSRYARKLQY